VAVVVLPPQPSLILAALLRAISLLVLLLPGVVLVQVRLGLARLPVLRVLKEASSTR
jgi:hypothetical protein